MGLTSLLPPVFMYPVEDNLLLDGILRRSDSMPIGDGDFKMKRRCFLFRVFEGEFSSLLGFLEKNGPHDRLRRFEVTVDGIGASFEVMGESTKRPYTLGIRVEPGEIDLGLVRRQVQSGEFGDTRPIGHGFFSLRARISLAASSKSSSPSSFAAASSNPARLPALYDTSTS